MSLRWLVLLILFLVVAVSYLATLNPTPVEVVLPLMEGFNTTAGLLMILSVSAGVFFALLFIAMRDWQEYFRRLARNKRERLVAEAQRKLARARGLAELGLDEAAASVLREAIEKDAELVAAHELAGDLKAAGSDFYAAAASHNRALSLQPENEVVRWKLARDHVQADNRAMAVKTLTEGLSLNEKSPFLLERYRELLEELGEWDEVVSIQGRLSKTKEYRGRPDQRAVMAGILYRKGLSLAARHRAEEAVKAFEEATRHDQDLSAAYIKWGENLLALDKEKNAQKTWALGYRRTSDPAVLSRLEEYYLGHDDPSRIINLYLRHIEERPRDAMLRFQFASLLFKLEMLQEAQGQIDEVQQIIGEENPSVSFLSFRLKQKRGDHAGALSDLRAFIDRCTPQLLSYTCGQCGENYSENRERCPSCGRWGSLRTTL